MKNIPFFDSTEQYIILRTELKNRLDKFFESQYFILGDNLKKFEKEFSSYLDCKYSVGVGNGTEALFLALKSLGIGNGDEVITVANTFYATALAIEQTGARTKLVDCDPETYQIKIENLGKVVNSKTKAIIPVHLYGAPCDIKAVIKFADEHNLYVIEDACQAHGAEVNGKKVGTFGDMGAFSFYPTKNLGSYGDAGAVVTNNKYMAAKLKQYRNYGQTEKYHYSFLGYNSRLDEIQAVILNLKLEYLDIWNKKRNQIADYYKEYLIDIKFQKIINGTASSYHLFVVEVDDRPDFIQYMNNNGVQTLIHYPIPLHLQPSLKHLGYKKNDFPHSERISERIVSLPIFPELNNKQLEKIVSTVNSYQN